ncbi:DJ-1/PfpI family protein [Kineococcus sp. SYSU DK004]|uniref:DJ-1/PfpI family protein n=1 Tax=Kineococcus sp. SYSU DK004 TaxID=3383125 RepID=UPI003D7EA5C2
MRAQVVLFDGFDPLDAVAPVEVLDAGGRASGGALTVELASAEGPREVPSGTGGIALRATTALDPEADLLVLPGASGPVDDPEDTGLVTVPVLLARTLETPLPALLERALEREGTVVATVCGGSLVLGMAGLLVGRHAVTHHLGTDLLEATGAVAHRARVVEDGRLVSGGAVTSGLDVGLHLLERLLGPQVALAVEELFAHERRGTVWRAAGLPGAVA